jgi:hypothetical protein
MRNSDFVSMISLFGWGRHTDRLNSEYKPLTYGEIAEEARRYGEYRRNFGYEQARQPLLSFMVVSSDTTVNFSNLERWYEIGEGENFGAYTLYKLTLKNAEQ